MFMKILFNYQGKCIIRANGPDTIRSKDNTMTKKRKRTKTIIYKTLLSKLDIDQHEPYKNPERVFLC